MIYPSSSKNSKKSKIAISRIIEKPIKEVFQQAVVPRLDNLSLGQHEISSKMTTKEEISNSFDKLDKKLDDIAKHLNK